MKQSKMPLSFEQHRANLLAIYQASLLRVNGKEAVQRFLEQQPINGQWAVVAIGKAAQAMAEGAVQVLGLLVTDCLVISKTGHLDNEWLRQHRCQGLESSHPVPDQRTLDAGVALLRFLESQAEETRLLFLISGGASSLVEVLPEGVTLEQVQQLNRWMLAAGWSIQQINRVRKSLSLIKGGGLLSYIGEREAQALFISDVPGNDPSVIGSGLLAPDIGGALPSGLPGWVEDIVRSKIDKDVIPGRCQLQVIATLEDAKEAAATAAHNLGYRTTIQRAFIDGDAVNVGQRLALELSDALPGIYIWGGEPTVVLPEEPGRGGRNQHLALSAAMILEGRTDLLFLAAGSDGTDGLSEDAGALVDGATLPRGIRAGLDPEQALFTADSGHFLEASGDLIHTGPTGTNVMDLMIGMKF